MVVSKKNFNKLPSFAQSIIFDLTTNFDFFNTWNPFNLIIEEKEISFNFNYGNNYNYIKVKVLANSLYNIELRLVKNNFVIEESSFSEIQRQELPSLLLEQIHITK
jgi:hypothetical protein